ncbi:MULTISPECIES: hypothetical protein [unclassified Micromonospora]|uniref:hypothetical protein n=1 Tax=unclassified Micromonospora TaxID=2617518 RepID=UPI003637D6E7
MTRVLLVPGRNDPLPEHWQEWLAGRDPARSMVRHATAGHMTTADGYGPWPLAEDLIARLSTP